MRSVLAAILAVLLAVAPAYAGTPTNIYGKVTGSVTITSSGTFDFTAALPANLKGVLPVANGGTGVSSIPTTTCLGWSGTAFTLPSCVTNVTAGGVLSSSGGATPNITLTGVVPIANGGTGSATQNFVDLSAAQTIAGLKTFGTGISTTALTLSGFSNGCATMTSGVVSSTGASCNLRTGTATSVAADGGTFSVTFAAAFPTDIRSVVLTPAAYSGGDNAAIFCRITASSTSGFSGTCGGGTSGSTITVNYEASGD